MQVTDNKPTNTYMLDGLEDLDLITISGGEPFIMPEYEGDFFEGRSAKLFYWRQIIQFFKKRIL